VRKVVTVPSHPQTLAPYQQHLYEFVTHSYVSQNVLSQQLQKVITVLRHPQSMARYIYICIYTYIHIYMHIYIYIDIWHIYTNIYVVYICAEGHHNSESPANYDLLSATHVDYTSEFVTHSYVSQNVFSQQVRKVVTIPSHPQTMASYQQHLQITHMSLWHIHMCHYGPLSATHVDHTYEFVTHSYVSLWPLIRNTCRSHICVRDIFICVAMAPYQQHM